MSFRNPGDCLQRTGAIIGLGLSAVSIGYGIAKDAKAQKASKAAQSKIEPYRTPEEVYQVLNATQANASSGFDPQTLNYLTSQTDNAFAGSLATAERIGADPNALSAIFGQKINGIMEIGAQNHQLQMQNFSAYLNALNAVGANSAAEQKSQQDLLKDQLQKIANDRAIAAGQISQGINAGLSTISSIQMAKLYSGNNPELNKFNKAFGNQGDSAYQYARDNNLSYREYQKQLKQNFGAIGNF